MEKTRDLFKKIRDTRVTFHAKMGSIKDRNGRDLTEAEDIKRCQEYNQSDFGIDHLVMSICRIISCAVVVIWSLRHLFL